MSTIRKKISIIAGIIFLIQLQIGCAQIKNTKTETAHIYGNCDMCKATIEHAGNIKKQSKVVWNKDTKMASITFDSIKTSLNEVLKTIALAGYDNEKYLAPDDVYAKLPSCCQYDRKAKHSTPASHHTADSKQSNTTEIAPTPTEVQQETPQLELILNNYLDVKDALVNSNKNATASNAKELLKALQSVKMEKLSIAEHTTWMKVQSSLLTSAKQIAEAKDIAQQRQAFITLSKDIYTLVKVKKSPPTMYYQFCPMANDGKGANWISREKEIKNPYYGSQMLTCGKVQEVIK